jgi:hypothetical protein
MTLCHSNTRRSAMRPAMVFGLSVLAICVSAITMVQAQPIPTGQLFLSSASVEVLAPGGLPNGNLNTGTLFTMLQFGGPNGTGVFAPPNLPAGFVLFNGGTTSFNKLFGIVLFASDFGEFRSTSVTETANIPGLLDLFFLGQWTPGFLEGVTGGPFPASLRLTLTQSPAFTGNVTAVGTFSVPPASQPPVIPEPSTIVMFLTGLPGAVAMYRRRRHCQLATA